MLEWLRLEKRQKNSYSTWPWYSACSGIQERKRGRGRRGERRVQAACDSWQHIASTSARAPTQTLLTPTQPQPKLPTSSDWSTSLLSWRDDQNEKQLLLSFHILAAHTQNSLSLSYTYRRRATYSVSVFVCPTRLLRSDTLKRPSWLTWGRRGEIWFEMRVGLLCRSLSLSLSLCCQFPSFSSFPLFVSLLRSLTHSMRPSSLVFFKLAFLFLNMWHPSSFTP